MQEYGSGEAMAALAEATAVPGGSRASATGFHVGTNGLRPGHSAQALEYSDPRALWWSLMPWR
jgi:hypothetical protein